LKAGAGELISPVALFLKGLTSTGPDPCKPLDLGTRNEGESA